MTDKRMEEIKGIELAKKEAEEIRKTKRPTRKASFVLVSTDHGTMILNRLDWVPDRPGYAVGVGCDILEHSVYERPEIDLTVGLVMLRKEYYGEGVIAIDGGANIGVHTIEMAKTLYPYKGQVIAFEPQERIYYALCGNIVLNNCHNAVALNVALGKEETLINIPVPDYTKPGSYGGLECKPPPQGGMVGTGQEPYEVFAPARMMKLDDLDIPRCDFIKLDLEGMEVEALEGGAIMIQEYRPVLMVEHIKSGMESIVNWMRQFDYEAYQFLGNMVCAHRLDKCLDHIRNTHRHLLRNEIGASDWDLEWVKFKREPVQEEAA